MENNLLVYFYEASNELVTVEFCPATGWLVVDWGDEQIVTEPRYLIENNFILLGEL